MDGGAADHPKCQTKAAGKASNDAPRIDPEDMPGLLRKKIIFVVFGGYRGKAPWADGL